MGTPIKVKKGQVLNYDYTGGVQSVTLPEGTYKLEVWGAEGGTAIDNYGGCGGYSVGTLTLTDESTVLYIQVGGYPASVGDDRVVVPGGYNGGGNGYNRYYNDTATYGQGGGGGTDIRIGQDSLYARVIVAGGGGGSASNGYERAKKYGGGLDGGCEASAYQAHQTPSTGSTNINFGTFGQGGAATTEGNNYKYGSGGGGGGWYGGAASNRYSDSETTLRTYNGGGSGYVYTADTATNYPSGCLLNSSYYLTDAQTVAGNISFPSPTSGGTQTGHNGNGYARITVLSVKSPISVPTKVDGQWHQANELFVKVNNVWKACVEGWMKVDGVWKSLAESVVTYDASWLNGLTVGDTFYFGKYQVESETPWPIEWEIVHQTSDYQIAMTKQIIDLRCFDAKESQNTDSDRMDYGNNNWSVGNIEQFLNSDQESWYSAQHEYDDPPGSANIYVNPKTPYDTHKGFLYYFSKEEKSLLKDITITLANNTVTDGGGSYTWTGKVWLPTYTQMSGNQNESIRESFKFDKYSDNNSRIKTINKYCAENNPWCVGTSKIEGTAWYYWMSSAIPSTSCYVWRMESNGAPISNTCASYGNTGLAPCICLPRHTDSGVTTYELSKFGSYVNTVKVNGTAVTLPIQVAAGTKVEVTSTGYDASAYSMIWSGPTPTSNRTASSGSTTARIVTFIMPSEDIIIRFNRQTVSSGTTYTISKGNNVASIFINNGSSITTSTSAKPGDTITVHSNSFSPSTVSAITWAGTGVPTANISYDNYVTKGLTRYRKVTFTMPANNVTTAFRKTSSGGSTDM